MESHNGSRVTCTVLGAEQLELFHRQMQEYQELLFKFSEGPMPVIIGIDSLQMDQSNSAKAIISILYMIQEKIAADIAKQSSENTNKPQHTTDVDGSFYATVSSQASIEPAPLSADHPLRPVNLRPANLPLPSPSPTVPELETLDVPSPVIESTPKATPLRIEQASPILLPPESSKLPQTDNLDLTDTGTQCKNYGDFFSDTETASDSDDSDYKQDEGNRVKYSKHVMREPEVGSSREEPYHNFSYASSDIVSKRQRNRADRYDPDNVKRIKEEGLYKSSDRRVKEEGAPIQADRVAWKDLQHYYGKDWKKENGKGSYFGKEVVVNPCGVGYLLKNNPTLGKDFFLTAQDALDYCLANCPPIHPLPAKTDVLHATEEKPLDIHIGK